MADFVATIIGIPHIPSIVEINVRNGPGTHFDLIFKAPLGLQARVVDCKEDGKNVQRDGRTHQWLKVAFPDGREGWVRDDLVTVQGDGRTFGYEILSSARLAFELIRKVVETIQNNEILTPTEPEMTTTQGTGRATATAMGKSGVNMRSGPSTNYNPPVTRFPYMATGEVLGAAPEDNNGSRFKWIRMAYEGRQGWVREDLLRVAGDLEAFNIGFSDSYPAPMKNSWWVRDWNLDPNFAAVHFGWDYGANVGEPILAGPRGGHVAQTLSCTRCTSSAPNTLSQGFGLNDPRVFSDPGWGFGYGNYVVVRYLNDILPASSRRRLAQQGREGAHLFVCYAHLNTIDVQSGQTLAPHQPVGTCGNTGNSEAPHLHLEIRWGMNPNETNYGNLINNRMDPIILFNR
jgi:uncharacterized protein YraI